MSTVPNECPEIRGLVADLVSLLANGEFEKIELLTRATRLTAEQIRNVVENYGRTLMALPPEAFNLMEVVKVEVAKSESWSVVQPLWSKEEGRSDLSLEMTLVRSASGLIIELDDLHVM